MQLFTAAVSHVFVAVGWTGDARFCVSTGLRHHYFNPNNYTGKYCVSLYYLLFTTLTHHRRHLFFSFCNGMFRYGATIYIQRMYDSGTKYVLNIMIDSD